MESKCRGKRQREQVRAQVQVRSSEGLKWSVWGERGGGHGEGALD